MTEISAAGATQSGFQQLSLASARRNADQASQMAESLRRQANAAQALADKYEVKAHSLDAQANKAQTHSEDANFRLNMANSFQQVGQQLVDTIQNAVVRQPVYAFADAGGTATATTQEQNLGSNIDVTA